MSQAQDDIDAIVTGLEGEANAVREVMQGWPQRSQDAYTRLVAAAGEPWAPELLDRLRAATALCPQVVVPDGLE